MQVTNKQVNIELSEVWGTSYLVKLMYDLIDRLFLCRKYLKLLPIQYVWGQFKKQSTSCFRA